MNSFVYYLYELVLQLECQYFYYNKGVYMNLKSYFTSNLNIIQIIISVSGESEREREGEKEIILIGLCILYEGNQIIK